MDMNVVYMIARTVGVTTVGSGVIMLVVRGAGSAYMAAQNRKSKQQQELKQKTK